MYMERCDGIMYWNDVLECIGVMYCNVRLHFNLNKVVPKWNINTVCKVWDWLFNYDIVFIFPGSSTYRNEISMEIVLRFNSSLKLPRSYNYICSWIFYHHVCSTGCKPVLYLLVSKLNLLSTFKVRWICVQITLLSDL